MDLSLPVLGKQGSRHVAHRNRHLGVPLTAAPGGSLATPGDLAATARAPLHA